MVGSSLMFDTSFLLLVSIEGLCDLLVSRANSPVPSFCFPFLLECRGAWGRRGGGREGQWGSRGVRRGGGGLMTFVVPTKGAASAVELNESLVKNARSVRENVGLRGPAQKAQIHQGAT